MRRYYRSTTTVFVTFDIVKRMIHAPSQRKAILLSVLFSALFILCSTWSMAQMNFEFTEGKYMIKGRVADLKSEEAVPFANVWITNQKKGVSAEVDGKFTMYVYPTDTLKFSALGYIPKTIPVSAIPDKEKYTFTLQLVPDIYSLKTVTIYPFHNKEEFIDQFIKGKGIAQTVSVSGIAPAKYVHKEKSRFYNPISSIYDKLKKSKSAADPNFKP
ncbi:MAG: hypothetical protein JWO03_2303 [Bacteroidetes bacterium]|nr:hypothetical protein [Bacteroidota bacterium]